MKIRGSRKSPLPRTAKTSASGISQSLETSVRKLRTRSSALSSIQNDASGRNTDASEDEGEGEDDFRPAKRQKRATISKASTKNANQHIYDAILGDHKDQDPSPVSLPAREHSPAYHRPLLLFGPRSRTARHALLSWFDTVRDARAMPWRKEWVNPANFSDPAELRRVLERRAYEVWISEIMLQQTRVAVVIGYWNSWIARWPTIHDLARAEADDVLSAWRGLGYYSRATRIHEAAKIVVSDTEMKGLLPYSATELEAKVPGVGRYTGGAISAIVFGHPAPMVDGNVLRVLSRQLGILGDVKSDKRVIETLWQAAGSLARAVAEDGGESDSKSSGPNDRPGRWGQALMELGSTVCTPKPNCAVCPITTTCRAYEEGHALAAFAKTGNSRSSARRVEDMEDMCSMCEALSLSGDDDTLGDEKQATKKVKTKTTKNSTISSFFTPAISKKPKSDPEAMATAVNHAMKFPLKKVKKQAKEDQILVCAIRRADGRYLIQRRPNKGLLAGLWELPSQSLAESDWDKFKIRRSEAVRYVASLLDDALKGRTKYVSEIGSIPWQFSHMKLTMHVHLFELDNSHQNEAEDCLSGDLDQPSKWVTGSHLDDESMGTGMRKCWAMVKDSNSADF